MNTEVMIAMSLFVAITTVTPGPNNIMIMASGLNFGARRSVPHMLGICFGFPVMVTAVGLGLGAFFDRYPQLHLVIKYLGMAYLLYLAWKIATTHTNLEHGSESRPLTFFQAAAFQWVNPKAWAMAVGAIATYTTVAGGAFFQSMIIAGTFLVLSLPLISIWLYFGVMLRKVLKDEHMQRTFNVTMGVLLAVSVLPMFVM